MKSRRLTIPLALIFVFVLLMTMFLIVDLTPPFLHFVELTALLVSIAALLFALKQFWDAGEALSSLQEIEQKAASQLDTLMKVGATLSDQSGILTGVSKQLSTQFVDRFPENLATLAEFVSKTRGNLDIVADFAGYGAYSNHDDFASYEGALKKCAQVSKIRFLLYEEDLVKTAIEQQWPNRDAFLNENEGKYLETFYRTRKRSIESWSGRGFSNFEDFKRSVTYEQFVKLQLEDERRIRKELLEIENIDISTIAGPAPGFMVHAWIVSDRALFSFDVTTAHLKELCFKTEDMRLRDIFSVIFESLWSAAKVKSKAAASSQ